ncbi:Glycosyltransferase Family 1 protein [Glomus cerebriforme]|uniref:Glycosyltransferase Family 1 protein n=1 Tax=Glomus cerebriforme TaxID=658196 RepID=A0A397T1D5_9GLOM|nr:Glycosyltransferase Family 1 protein [Glomus cerebriforme]
MRERNFIFLLLIFFLLNLVFRVDVSIATQGYLPRNAEIDHIPKNILFGSFAGGRSHVKPMLDVAAILIERGHNVILLTSGNYTPASEYPTVKQITLGPPMNLREIKGIRELIDKDFDFSRVSTIHEIAINTYKDIFEKYKKAVKEYNIDLLVCSAAMNDPCLDVGHALKKPVVGFISFLNALEPKSYKSDPIFRCNISMENESFLERFRCTVIQPLRMVNYIYPFITGLNDIRKQIDVEPVFLSVRRLTQTSLILVDTFFGFELPQPLSPNIQEIGPVMSEEYPPLSPELSDFINAHKRVLYVAFGTRFFTSVENNSKLLQSFVEVINKNIIDGVVWALVQTLKDDFNPTLNLSDGSQIQTSSILSNEHPHIHIASFAPQFAVLNHTNTKLFLSHGGASSSHESLYTGTPMLILPFGGDQLGNAEKLKSAGIALSLNKMKLDVNDIVNKMDILLKDENVKKNSKRMEILAKINSKRKFRAADLIEYILYSSNTNEINEEFLKEWIPAGTRMGFIRGNNYDVYGALLSIILGIVGGILWVTFKLIRFIVNRIPSSAVQKPKRE